MAQIFSNGHKINKVFCERNIDRVYKGNVLVFGGQNCNCTCYDFVNLTAHCNATYISLKEAISLIPNKYRIIGQVITFIDENGNWKIYQFHGYNLSEYEDTTKWVDLNSGSSIPDKTPEDILKEKGISAIENVTVRVGETSEISVTMDDAIKNAEGLIINYQSTDENIATVSNKGIVTGVSEGITKITVSVTIGKTTKSAEAAVSVINNHINVHPDQLDFEAIEPKEVNITTIPDNLKYSIEVKEK